MRRTAKHNITLAIDKRLLKLARGVAAQRGLSVSAMLADELSALVDRETLYQQAKARALAHLASPFHLGATGMGVREDLHDRKGLR